MEAALTDLIGVDLANKFHRACNKDDQVATVFRLWCRAAIDSVLVKIKLLQEALVRLAFKNNALMVPVCTPLQKAQLLSLPHVLLAYVEKV